ncbi:MAG: hypothetical protein J5I93_05245 [Pirellulaceae bacterium]|nr:hypothetical protein [Pirellulaceae bacterium]
MPAMDQYRDQQLVALIDRVRQGDQAAFTAAAKLVEDLVRQVARAKLRSEKHRGLLQTTLILDEVLLKLYEQGLPDSVTLRAFVARVVHNLLIDQWRRQSAGRRGGGQRFVSLQDSGPVAERDVSATDAQLLRDLDEALSRLAELDPLAHQVVQCHRLLGMTLPETAATLGVSLSTANRKWSDSKRQLRDLLTEGRV